MTYKDQTFCHDWCDNKQCFRNYQHIVDAEQKNEINEQTLISFFVSVPLDCKERIPKNNP
jgi:hypothetical protein